MAIRYIGRAFRIKHGINQKELAAGAGVRAATLVDLEHERRAPNVATVERIVGFFRQQGIDCTLADFLVYEDPTQETNGAQGPHE
jgi:DNA-binding XRE family transcriptional regulator